MNENNLVKRIIQIEDQILLLEETDMDDTLRKEYIDRNIKLKEYYKLQLRDIKWNYWKKVGKSGSNN